MTTIPAVRSYPKLVWERIPVVSVEDGDARVCGPYLIETTWGVETGYTRKWRLRIDGVLQNGTFNSRKEAKQAASTHANAGRWLWLKDWFARHSETA
jgi:hypothetical protein